MSLSNETCSTKHKKVLKTQWDQQVEQTFNRLNTDYIKFFNKLELVPLFIPRPFKKCYSAQKSFHFSNKHFHGHQHHFFPEA